ncbi:uroporphyrinogen III methyltransferase [Flavobacterium noncentrifugens]|uniref:Uroporphyrinogen-III synthase n=1 Tax=Flavobacterium noncentrifugens TaxID=1128970 RepID=A0A1G8T548_9FLAO|nr:uroporphyrinogen-III synthase [Flavobacterium noncentrifugens]GEP50091.1 uroporphyrinogen III methyltransferase [Flavobacterium noncentrifugens]SDJ36531.1 uroporphyrinogen-III synthase [Flavobacterium noncentrifugens]
MIRIFSTKKLQPNQKQFLLNAGFSVVEADFINIRNTEFTFSNIHDNLIFTSGNTVKAVSNHPDVQDIRRNPAFCVGEKTANLLDENGFTVQEIANSAAELAQMIIAQYPMENFTFFNGNLRLDELPNQLKKANVLFNEVEVYKTVLTPSLINTATDGILFFSPSAVESFLSINKITNETCFCIGNTTAKALEKNTKNIIIANQPSVENTIIQTINYYKQS